jgi:hypothetical protein
MNPCLSWSMVLTTDWERPCSVERMSKRTRGWLPGSYWPVWTAACAMLIAFGGRAAPANAIPPSTHAVTASRRSICLSRLRRLGALVFGAAGGLIDMDIPMMSCRVMTGDAGCVSVRSWPIQYARTPDEVQACFPLCIHEPTILEWAGARRGQEGLLRSLGGAQLSPYPCGYYRRLCAGPNSTAGRNTPLAAYGGSAHAAGAPGGQICLSRRQLVVAGYGCVRRA